MKKAELTDIKNVAAFMAEQFLEKEELQKISKIFYTTKEHGTGLGVALSKEIIEQHHGTLHYDSKVGKGTKITIILPIK